MTTVDVTLVAYGSAETIAEAIRGAVRIGCSTSVVVVDHHGADGAAEIAAELGAVTIVDRTNRGFGAGQNRAVAETTAPYVLLLNPDARIDPAAVAAGAQFLDRHPDVAAVQGLITNRVTGSEERSQGVLIRPVHLLGRALGLRWLLRWTTVRRLARRSRTLRDHANRRPGSPVQVEWLAATALLVRRQAFEEVGGFDESYFLYGEDLDLCRRWGERGWRLIALPGCWAHHVSGASSPVWADREVVWWEGTMRYAARWWTPARFSVALAGAVLQWMRVALDRPSDARVNFSRMVLSAIRCR